MQRSLSDTLLHAAGSLVGALLVSKGGAQPQTAVC